MTIQDNWLESGSLRWFYRDAKPVRGGGLPVLLLHGLPAQSYSWRQVLESLAEQGFWAIAPDWVGFGLSDKPDRRDFAYTPDAYVAALDEFVQRQGLERFHLVVQGFVGSVGLQYALRHPDRVDRLAIFNAPLSTTMKVPWRIRQLGLPLAGDMLTQDPLLVDRTLEGGGKYRVEDEDLDVYRRPFLKSSDAGRSLLAVVRNLQFPSAMAEIEAGLQAWENPLLVAWGAEDPWLPVEIAEAFTKSLKNADFARLEQVGHYPQQDWHEKVSEALIPFLRRQII